MNKIIYELVRKLYLINKYFYDSMIEINFYKILRNIGNFIKRIR